TKRGTGLPKEPCTSEYSTRSSCSEREGKMISFIFSFRPLLLAVATIACVEIAVALVDKPNIVERSNYFNWAYSTLEPYHKLVVHQKLSELVSSQPDIIQVGDSSGFHGIRSKTVMEYLDGLSYLNLSCCANTGFDGYYDIAKFALDHSPNIRAVVLYLTRNNLPQQSRMGGDQELGSTKIHDSFAGPWAFIKLPSLALRPVATDAVYNRFNRSVRGVALQNRLSRAPMVVDMLRSVKDERGWWAEHDRRLVGARRQQLFAKTCDDVVGFYTVETLSSRTGEFLPLVAFDNLAALANRRGV